VYLYGIRSSLSNRAEWNLLLLVGRISPAPADLFEKRVYSEQHRTRILTLDHDLGFLNKNLKLIIRRLQARRRLPVQQAEPDGSDVLWNCRRAGFYRNARPAYSCQVGGKLQCRELFHGRWRWTIRQYATQRFPIPGETNFAAVNQLFRLIQHMPYTLG